MQSRPLPLFKYDVGSDDLFRATFARTTYDHPNDDSYSQLVVQSRPAQVDWDWIAHGEQLAHSSYIENEPTWHR